MHRKPADLQDRKIRDNQVNERFIDKHVNERFSIDGYDLFRRDRLGRRGGGVAIYARHDLLATEWTFQVPPEPLFELLWIKISTRQRDFSLERCIIHQIRSISHPDCLTIWKLLRMN